MSISWSHLEVAEKAVTQQLSKPASLGTDIIIVASIKTQQIDNLSQVVLCIDR